jgi:hypothetical protein
MFAEEQRLGVPFRSPWRRFGLSAHLNHELEFHSDDPESEKVGSGHMQKIAH